VSFGIVPVSALASLVAAANATADQRLTVQLLAHITVFGTLGGSTIDAEPFDYPVTVCNDCVVQLQVPPACPLTVSAPALGDACNPYQDGTVDCCTSNGQLLCGAEAPTM
jgi:hypothetical protein